MSVIFINPYLFGAAATDPDFASVSLLLHGDGTNGSTTIIDNSPSPKTLTAVGNAQISTVQSKFGGASIVFDGNGDYLTTSSNTDFAFGTGNFTVEAWVYFGNLTAFSTIIGTRINNNSATAWSLGIDSSEKMYFYSNAFLIQGSASLAQNTWHYLAVSRDGSNLRGFHNGTQIGSTVSDTRNYTTDTLVVGATTDFGQQYNGYIDDLRVTKGVARYTASFTAPTAPFPDS